MRIYLEFLEILPALSISELASIQKLPLPGYD
jgi:hypothetical protein